ncbi:hypothetical protein C8A03DRAFT_37834 [Achaetomium macrosporum]|uniref:Uncharacterized protein n=1 Tax=Achaetomium macrosporum TaxID=79813 RepID=A0AAN7C4M2_9PEZI|nr:hypothetical protein C8A03DRAFT_37834 [Achaetomium macrosporum]
MNREIVGTVPQRDSPRHRISLNKHGHIPLLRHSCTVDSKLIFKCIDALSHFIDRAIRWAWRSTNTWTIEFLPRTYDERSDKDAELRRRWLYLTLHLLDDTVTEVVIARDCESQSTRLPCKTQPNPESEYSSIVGHLWARTQEDWRRVRYLVFDSASGIPTRDHSEIEIMEEEELYWGVYKRGG